MCLILWEEAGVLGGGELPEVWKDGGRMGVHAREKRRKVDGKKENQDEIKRMRETWAQNRTEYDTEGG